MNNIPIHWNCAEEWFHLMGEGFDIQQAKMILSNKDHKVESMELEESGCFGLIGLPGRMTMGIQINWDKVQNDPEISLDIPIILAYSKRGSLIPVDGWHRIAKAKLAGIKELPSVILTKTESKKIRCK